MNLFYFWFLVLYVHGTLARVYHRIYSGLDLRPEVHNYLVKLKLHTGDIIKGFELFGTCSGSIISERWIISAAHCFPIYVTLVQVQQDVAGIVKKLPDVNGRNIIKYPGFIQSNSPLIPYEMAGNDIALLKTSEDIDFDYHTHPIELPTKNVRRGTKVIVAGYGDNEEEFVTPREGLTIVEQCSEPQSRLICTRGRVRAGNGDSGGAMVLKTDNDLVLVGVISASCTDVDVNEDCESIYANVFCYLDWIEFVTYFV